MRWTQFTRSFFTGDCYVALNRDAYSDVQSVHQEVSDPAEIATLFDGAIVYSKGAHLMLMLIRLMGWDSFCKGVADYFDKYKYKNTVGDDLWKSLKPYAEFDPKKLMHAFIDKPGYPVVTTNGAQKRFLLDGVLNVEEWPIPEITEDMSGHYVINLSDEEFGERLENFESLGLEERIRLLIDRNLISKTELVSSSSLIPLVKKFQNEDSASVWSIVASIVGGLKVFFEPDSNEEKKFKKFVGNLVAEKLDKIGIVTKKDDDENTIRLRAILLGFSYYAEDKKVLEELAEMYDADYTKMDSEIRENILNAKLYFEPELIDEYMKAYVKTADPELKSELLFAGTLSKDEKVLSSMTALLEKPEIVKPQDQLYLFVYLFRNSKVRQEVFDWMTSHWDYVKKMAGDKSLENYPRYTANVIRTQAEYEAWQEFFGSKRNDLALSRAIKIGEKEIKARLKLITQDQSSVLEVLESSDN